MIDDIEDEEEINNNIIPNASLMNGEDINLVQASKDYIDAVRAIANNPWDHISWFMYLEEVRKKCYICAIHIPQKYRFSLLYIIIHTHTYINNAHMHSCSY